MKNGFYRYLLYILFQAIPFCVIISLFFYKKESVVDPAWVALFFINILPLFELGLYNDLVLRTPLPFFSAFMFSYGAVMEQNFF